MVTGPFAVMLAVIIALILFVWYLSRGAMQPWEDDASWGWYGRSGRKPKTATLSDGDPLIDLLGDMYGEPMTPADVGLEAPTLMPEGLFDKNGRLELKRGGGRDETARLSRLLLELSGGGGDAWMAVPIEMLYAARRLSAGKPVLPENLPKGLRVPKLAPSRDAAALTGLDGSSLNDAGFTAALWEMNRDGLLTHARRERTHYLLPTDRLVERMTGKKEDEGN